MIPISRIKPDPRLVKMRQPATKQPIKQPIKQELALTQDTHCRKEHRIRALDKRVLKVYNLFI